MTRIYRGIAPQASMDWHVVMSADGHTEDLPLRLDVVNHSPSGFAWGYAGSGPAQLALAILCDAIGPDVARDPQLYQRFKAERIATLDNHSGWEMTLDQVLDWVEHSKPRA